VETITTVARTIAEAKSMCVLWAMGVTQHIQGSDISTAISNLLLITGNYMRPGTGAYPLRGHNNVQGASDHGAMPNMLPGYQSVDDPEVRQRFEAGWKVTLPTAKGLDNHQMVDAIDNGKLKAMYLIGEEMSIVDSNATFLSCRTFFSAIHAGTPMLCCRGHRAWKKKAPSPAPKDASSDCIKC
jgi:formate dehydrogenase major subunit